jgi:fatty-acyl-CoA synthase
VAGTTVIAIKDDVYREDIEVFVALKTGQEVTAEEICIHCTTKLTNFLIPKEVLFMPALPKNIVGKIVKKDLRNL